MNNTAQLLNHILDCIEYHGKASTSEMRAFCAKRAHAAWAEYIAAGGREQDVITAFEARFRIVLDKEWQE